MKIQLLLIIFGLIIYGCGPSRLQKKMSLPTFDRNEDYRRRNIPRVNPEFKDVPVMDTFKTNFFLETLCIDDSKEKKFILDSLRPYALSLYKKQTGNKETKIKYELIHLPSEALLIVPADKKDKRIFIVMRNQGYYFVIRNGIIWFAANVDENRKMLGLKSVYDVVDHQVPTIRYLVLPKSHLIKKN